MLEKQQEENRSSSFIAPEEPRRFPGTFTVFIINRKYAQFSSRRNRRSSGQPEDKQPLNLSVIVARRSEAFCIFNNLIKRTKALVSSRFSTCIQTTGI